MTDRLPWQSVIKTLLLVFAWVMTSASPVVAVDQPLDRVFYSKYYIAVEQGLAEAAKKHGIYTYIIANASTPGLDLVSLLPPEDQEKLFATVPRDGPQSTEVILEFVLAQMAVNSKRAGALAAIWGGKGKSLKHVISLGK